MATLVLQFVCAALMAMGLFFIGVELRARYDRSLLYFGSSLLVLCGIASIDLWILPRVPLEQGIYYTRLQHIFTIAFAIFLNLYLMKLTGRPIPSWFKHTLIGGGALNALLVSTPYLVIAKDGKVGSTFLYSLTFVPYLVFTFGGVVNSLLIQSRHAGSVERRMLRFHLGGAILLILGGSLDMIAMSMNFPQMYAFIPSYTSLGILGFGVSASAIFAERFFQLLVEKEQIYKRLETAFVEMESANRLRQLGESTAMINHEIKNYMFMISGNAQMLQEFETLSAKGKSMVENIISAVDRLNRFSKDILELSRTQLLQEKYPVDLSDLVRRSCATHFADRKEFLLLRIEPDVRIYGDSGKLEQVLVNLIKNAFEATRPGEMPDIHLTLRQTSGCVLLTLEDHGMGCSEENLPNLFKAFHTTKKSKGGNGLGMSLSRTVIESHGGKISAYSKNFNGDDAHGLIMHILFPSFDDPGRERAQIKAPLVLLPDAMDDLEGVLRILGNAALAPYVVNRLDELEASGTTMHGKTLLFSSRSKLLSQVRPQAMGQVALITSHHRQLYITGQAVGGQTELFTEELALRLVGEKDAGKSANRPASSSPQPAQARLSSR
jgi:signal transduction histidine kinase